MDKPIRIGVMPVEHIARPIAVAVIRASVFSGIIISLFILGGCTWAYLQYVSVKGSIDLSYGRLRAGADWAEYDDQTGRCTIKTFYQEKGEPLDSLLILWITIIPKDTLQSLMDLQKRFDISHIWITIDTCTIPIKLDKCVDTSVFAGSWDGSASLPRRDFCFGPMPVSWPFPKSIMGSLDLINNDPSTGIELYRERLHFEVKKEVKSALSDFIDGR